MRQTSLRSWYIQETVNVFKNYFRRTSNTPSFSSSPSSLEKKNKLSWTQRQSSGISSFTYWEDKNPIKICRKKVREIGKKMKKKKKKSLERLQKLRNEQQDFKKKQFGFSWSMLQKDISKRLWEASLEIRLKRQFYLVHDLKGQGTVLKGPILTSLFLKPSMIKPYCGKV